MSLQVWLPLNGDLHNQGCTDYTITAFEASSTFTTGKIGQCYQRANTSSQITNGLQIQDNLVSTFGTAASVAVWVKPLGTHTHYNGTILSSGDWNKKRWAFGVSQDNSQVDVLCGGYNNYISCAVPVNQWTHLVSTFENGVCKLYKNGAYVGEKTGQAAFDSDANWTGICRETYAGGYFGFNGCINDLRIYDHCLSAAEVKEISQGLVLHYKLDSIGPSFGNPNLLLEGMTPTAAGNGATGVVRSIENGVQKIVADNPNSNWCTFANHNTTLALTKGDTFTFSLMIRSPDSNKKPTVYFQSGLGYYGMQGTMSNNWSIIYYTGTWNIDNLQTNIHLGFSSAPGTYYIKYFKLEKGGSVTPWAPKEGEALSDLKYIEDSSGYNHNGSILGDVKISSDTARYQSSVDLLAASTAINCGRGGMITDSITVNIWLKSSAWNNPVSCTEGGGWNFEASGDYFRFPIYISGVGYKYGQSTTTRAQLCNNQWHMLTGIYDRINQKVQIYVDGKLDNDYAAGTSNNIGYNGSNVIWIGAEASGSNTAPNNYGMRGLFSDFRIYSTALSAADILELYHTGAKIDNKGNTHTYEFVEHQDNILFPAELSRTKLEFTNGLNRYTQANCQVNLVEDGYHIYRPPNLTQSANGSTMWGGLKLVNQSTDTVAVYDANRDNWWHLQQNHTYIAAFHVRGKSSNATTWSWTNNMGWGGGGVQPSPTTIVNEGIPADFNGEKDCFYIFKITDAISKSCTTAYSAYIAGITYLSYRHLTFGWGYTSTGTLGTDLYLTNFRLYDITSNMAQFTKQGQANFYDIVEQMDKAQIRKNSELLSSEFLEL